jgi:hypothetical protein
MTVGSTLPHEHFATRVDRRVAQFFFDAHQLAILLHALVSTRRTGLVTLRLAFPIGYTYYQLPALL